VTIELLDSAAEDAEEVLVAWLQPLRATAVQRETGDPLPFTIVTQVAGTEDVDLEIADPIVSVHILVDKALGWDNAKEEKKLTERRMSELARWQDYITMSDGRVANVDYVTVVEPQHKQPYEDTQIIRYVGRYQIGLSYVPVT
jgi:hypothetical protein